MSAYQNANQRYMVIKAETTPGTAETLAGSDFDIRFRNIAFTPNIAMDNENAKYMQGNHAEDNAISGVRSGTITCSVNCAFTTGATEPNWWKASKACGQGSITYDTDYTGLVPRALHDDTTYTIGIYDVEAGESSPVTTLYTFAGCVGNVVYTVDSIGAPLVANYTFQGKFVSASDTSALTIASTTQTFLASNSLGATVELNSVAESKISQWQLDIGNEINPIYCVGEATGILHYTITARRPRLSMNPLAVATATRNWYNEITSDASLGSLVITASDYILSCPDVQLLSMNQSVREGLNGWDLNFKLLQNGTPGSLTDSNLTLEDTFILYQPDS